MHHLHPRSRTTSTLFTTTLAMCFLVVGLPHILPCPVDRRQFADTIEMPDGTIKRRKRRVQNPDSTDRSTSEEDTDVIRDGRPPRECPVPKPGGMVGQIMGFEKREKERVMDVVVQAREKGRERRLEEP